MPIIYEGIFFDTELTEVMMGFIPRKKRAKTPNGYHTTTEFKPTVTHEELYNEQVICTVDRYKSCDENGAEGFHISKMETENKELQALLDSIDKNWHITLSFDNKPVDTNNIDFSKDYLVTYFKISGKFNGFFSKKP